MSEFEVMAAHKPSINTNYFLDITALVCPMTFVRTKLLIEKMASGETCEIRLKGAEPLQNVPRSARELGHEIISLTPEGPESTESQKTPEAATGVYRLLIMKR